MTLVGWPTLLSNVKQNLCLKGKKMSSRKHPLKGKKWVMSETLHRIVWTWVSKHPGCSKASWPGWKRVDATCYCPACHVAYTLSNNSEIKEVRCSFCPLLKNKTGLDANRLGIHRCFVEPYSAFCDTLVGAPKETAKIAKQIAELPWNGPSVRHYIERR